MSVQAITWAMQAAAGSAARKLVLLTLANFANESGEAYPTYETLIRATELNRKTVASALAGLESDGLICDTGERRGATRQVVVYRLGMAPSDRVEVPKSRRERVPKTAPLNSTENGTVPKTEQYRFYHETVPFLDGKSTENGTQNHQGTVKEPTTTTARETQPKNATPDVVVANGNRQTPEAALALPADILKRLEGKPPHWHDALRDCLLGADIKSSPTRYLLRILQGWEHGENPPKPPPPPRAAGSLKPAPAAIPAVVPVRAGLTSEAV